MCLFPLGNKSERTIGNAEPDTYIRILSEKERTLTELSMIETELTNVLGQDISFEAENRIQEKIDNDAMLNGYKLIIGALCVLLASHRDRQRIFQHAGIYPAKEKRICKIYVHWHDAREYAKNVLDRGPRYSGRPVLITLPITVVFVWLMITQAT